MKDNIIELKWYDACSRSLSEEELKLLNNLESGIEFLAINKTYGKILKKLNDVIVLTTEDSDSSELDVTIIPRSWIISPENLK